MTRFHYNMSYHFIWWFLVRFEMFCDILKSIADMLLYLLLDGIVVRGV